MSGGSKPYIVGGRISPKGVVLAALPTQALRRLAPAGLDTKKPTSLTAVGTAMYGVSTLLEARVQLVRSNVNNAKRKNDKKRKTRH